MNIRYKLSSQNRTTYDDLHLPPDGEWFSAKNLVDVPEPCSSTVLHHYAHPLLAVLFNPIHGNYPYARLFKVEIDEEVGTDGLKGWCRRQRIIRELPLPVITTEQRVAFAIYVAEPYFSAAGLKWATNWMNGTDRTLASSALAEAAIAVVAWGAEAASAAARAAAEAARAAAAARTKEANPPQLLAIIQRVIKEQH